MTRQPLDGCLFVGTTLQGNNEIADVEFGAVQFSARVLSRTTFRVEGSRIELIAMRSRFTVGEYAPLTVGLEHLGNACLDELLLDLRSTTPSRLDLTFVHAEVMPP